MPLTDLKVRSAKPKPKAYRLFDERGLYLEVAPAGGKWWRFKYRLGGKEKRISLGVYPDVGLKDARDRRDEARKQVANGIDPSLVRKAEKRARADALTNSFEAVAREWFEKHKGGWSPSHGDRILRRLERDIFPHLGKRPIAELTAPALLCVLRRIENRGAIETTHRALQNCGQIMRYAIATGRAERDIAADLKGAIPPPQERRHPTITDPSQIGQLLRAIDGYTGDFPTLCALRLAPLTFVRPGELRRAEWAEIDFERKLWKIPAEKMKGGFPHLVPLSRQAFAILQDLEPHTGQYKYLFPGLRSKLRPMSENTVNGALRRLGYSKEEMTGHGFRSMASTNLNENG